MKSITHYITEKANFLVKKHLPKRTVNCVADIEEGDFIYEHTLPGGGYEGGEYLTYCISKRQSVYNICSVKLEKNMLDKLITLEKYDTDTESFEDHEFSLNIPAKYERIFEDFKTFINKYDFSKIKDKHYTQGVSIATYLTNGFISIL